LFSNLTQFIKVLFKSVHDLSALIIRNNICTEAVA
jgi:hypothetical protein